MSVRSFQVVGCIGDLTCRALHLLRADVRPEYQERQVLHPKKVGQ